MRSELPTRSLTNGWLSGHEAEISAQLANADERPGPQTLGPLEQKIHQLRQRLAQRVQGLDNPDRTPLLLNLLTAGMNNQANADLWAERIDEHLLEHQRRPPRRQRQIAGASMRSSPQTPSSSTTARNRNPKPERCPVQQVCRTACPPAPMVATRSMPN